ncbi:MAG: S8 family peptidase [Candidatus Rifleibacteriota bacterium]
MCKRGVLVNLKPGLFTILLVLTLIAIAEPGACRPRFIYLNEKTDYSSISEDLADTVGNRRGVKAILSEGQLRVNKLLSYLPNSVPAVAAGGVFADLSDEQFDALRKIDPAIESSDYHEAELEALSTINESTTQRNQLWNFNLSGVNLMKQFYSASGENRTLAVISLDYPYGHTSLQGKVKNYKLFGQPVVTRGLKDLYLVHPLGIIAAQEETMYEGIAPKCNVILAQISQKAVKTTTLLEAIEWLLTLETPPDAILFCTDFGTAAPLAIQRALFACRNAGIIPILPAGNNPNSISGMAALPCCITVGAIDQWKQRSLFSGAGPVVFQGPNIMKPDCVEPGSNVLGPTDTIEYKFGSGTLQAAAHFAGIYLQVKQVVPPETDPETIVSALLTKTTDIGAAGADNETGFGLPEPAAAVTHILYPPEEEEAH